MVSWKAGRFGVNDWKVSVCMEQASNVQAVDTDVCSPGRIARAEKTSLHFTSLHAIETRKICAWTNLHRL